MRTNVYESTVLINAALDDEQLEQEVSRLQDYIVSLGGEINEVEKWGRKRLAYMINKSKIGYYAIYRFTATSNVIAKLERAYVLDENIIRFLTIQLDKNAIEYFEKNKAAAAQEMAEAGTVTVAPAEAVSTIEEKK